MFLIFFLSLFNTASTVIYIDIGYPSTAFDISSSITEDYRYWKIV